MSPKQTLGSKETKASDQQDSQVNWTQVVGDQRPNMVCTVTMPKAKPSQIKVSGMIDTGADIAIISANMWLPSWSTTPMGSAIAGLGRITQSFLSSNPVLIKNTEGQTATVQPYITTVPFWTCGGRMFCLHGESGWGLIFYRSHCVEGRKVSHTNSKMAYNSACVDTTVAPWGRKIKCPKNTCTRTTSTRTHKTIYEPIEHSCICGKKGTWVNGDCSMMWVESIWYWRAWGLCKPVCLLLQWYLLPGTSWLWAWKIFFLLFHCPQMIPQSLLLQWLPLITLHQCNVINGVFFHKECETGPQFVSHMLHKYSYQWESSFQGHTVITTWMTFWLQPKHRMNSCKFSQTCCKH